jgi:hypothetical protein
MDLRKGVDKIHGDVGPHVGRHIQGLQETSWLCRGRFVALTHSTRADEVVHQLAVAGNVEVTTQPHESLLDALMPRGVRQGHDLVAQVLQVGDVDAFAMEEETVRGGPGCLQRPCCMLL